MHHCRPLLVCSACVAILLACNGADLVLPDEGEPAEIVVVQGDEQVGRVGEALAEPLVALVTDTRGRPVVDVPVALRLDDAAGAEVAPTGTRTDVDGTAAFQVVLGSRVGTLAGRVAVVPASGEPTIVAPVRFTAVSADAAGMTLAGGDGQSAPVGSALPDPLVVQVADVFGNPIAGVVVTWEIEGGGSVSATSTATDTDGRATVERTLGPSAGVQRTRARADGLAGSPVTFSHTATSGAAARLEPVSGSGQSAVAGTPLAEPLVVRLLDPAGNPVPGTAVAWVVGEGGGTVAPETVPTDQQGFASTTWTLGGPVGVQTATAVVSGVGVVDFTATALPGTPPGLRIVTQPAASAQRGIVLARQPVVQLVDPGGAELRTAGVPVTVAVAAGGGRVRGTLTRTTGADGRAVFTDLALEGPAGRYTLAFGASGYSGAVSDAIELARAATTTSIASDAPDPSAPGAVVRVVFTVTSEGGRPGGSVTVRADDGATCRAAVSAGACSLALTTAGTQQLTASYEGDAEFAPSSDTEGHLVEVPAAPTLALATQPSTSAVAGVPFDRQPVVQLRDGAGNAVAAAGVAVTAGIASGPGTLVGQATRTTDASGRVVFEGLGIGGATGAHVLRFTAQGYTPVASSAIEVRAAPTTVRIESDAPDPSNPGEPVQVAFTVTSPAGTPAGDVTVSGGGGSCTNTIAAGGCSLVLTQPGSHTLTASYAGGGGFAAASDTEAHTVSPPAPSGPSPSASSVTVDPATIEVGDQAGIRVTVRDAGGRALAGATVQVSAPGSGHTIEPGSAETNGGGVAEFAFRSSVAGPKTITAVADGVTLEDQPTITVVAAATRTRIVSHTPEPSAPGQAIDVRVRVDSDGGTPPGSVTVSAGGDLTCAAPLSGGEGGCALTPASAGTLTITASYPGSDGFQGSSDQVQHRVQQPAARILVLRTQPSGEATPGEPFDRQPEVQLSLEDGTRLNESGVVVQAALASGGGTLTGTTTATTGGDGRAQFDNLAIQGPEGSYTIVFTAAGFASVTSSTIELVRFETDTEITSDDPDPSAPGQPFTVQFRVRGDGGTPGGEVQVAVAGGGPSCSGPVGGDGEGSCSLTLDQEGEFTLVATYPGDTRFAPSQSEGEDHEVEAPNVAPSAADDEFSVLEDAASLDVPAPGVLANDEDPDGDPLQAVLVTNTAAGSVNLGGGGGFRYEPPANFSGLASFTYLARDADAASSTATVRITVQPVNDPPSFEPGGDQEVSAAAGPQSVSWASAISAGPGEEGQALRFVVTVVEGAELFQTAPTVSPSGILEFEPAAPGTAAAEVRLVDDGGTSNGGEDTSSAAVVRFTFIPEPPSS